jgi:tetratricopeptide (TPR) repeat protein
LEKSTEKYALIYEFNNGSPLFARVAFRYIEEKDYEQAISILEKGLSNYPEYPTAYYLYSIALANCGEKTRAIEMAKIAADLHGTSESLQYYTDKINDITSSLPKEPVQAMSDTHPGNRSSSMENVPEDAADDKETLKENAFDNNRDENIIETKGDSADSQNKLITDEDEKRTRDTIQNEGPDKTGSVNEFDEKAESDDKSKEVDDELDMLAKKLSNAVMPGLDDSSNLPAEKPSDDTQFQGKRLVSETLAKIHMNQGNYSQALSIYETLINIQPEKRDYYRVMIDQIKDKL